MLWALESRDSIVSASGCTPGPAIKCVPRAALAARESVTEGVTQKNLLSKLLRVQEMRRARERK